MLWRYAVCDIPFTTPDGTTAITDRGERELAAASQRKTAKCEIVDFKIDPCRGPLLTDLRYDPGFAKISSNSGNFSVFFRLPTQNLAFFRLQRQDLAFIKIWPKSSEIWQILVNNSKEKQQFLKQIVESQIGERPLFRCRFFGFHWVLFPGFFFSTSTPSGAKECIA